MKAAVRNIVGTMVIAAALAALSGCGLIPTSKAPQAKQRVAVLEIKHTSSPHFRSAIKNILQEHYDVVDRSQYEAAARRLKVRGKSRKSIAAVSSELNLDATIEGRIVRRGKRFLLRLQVRDGSTGEKVELVDVPVLRRRRVSESGQLKLRTGLLAALDKLPAAESTSPSVAADEPPKPEAKAGHATIQANASQRGAKQGQAKAREHGEQEKPSKAAKAQDTGKRHKLATATGAGSKKSEKVEDESSETPSMAVRYDDSGQALDDEVPDALR